MLRAREDIVLLMDRRAIAMCLRSVVVWWKKVQSNHRAWVEGLYKRILGDILVIQL